MKTQRVWDGYFKVDVVETISEGKREVVRARPAICLLLHNPSKNNVILIMQNRPAMILNKRPYGTITEVVAGRLNKSNHTPRQIASDKAWHKAGIRIAPEKIMLLNNQIPMASSPGFSDEMVYYAYGEIGNENIDFTRGTFGDPKENEHTTRVFFTIEEFENHICETIHTFALKHWFLLKMEKEKTQKSG